MIQIDNAGVLYLRYNTVLLKTSLDLLLNILVIRSIFKIMDKEKFIEYFYGDKKLVHLQILEMVKIGIVEKEHACLHGNLNFYKKNINKA